MTEGVGRDALGEPRLSDSFAQRLLDVRVTKMIPPPLLILRDEGERFLREKPEELPSAGANGSENHERPPADYGASRFG